MLTAAPALGITLEGKGVSQSYKEAIKWYRLAAQQGDALAQVKLGIMYETGDGIAQDYKEAIMYYRLAAEQGDAQGQLYLGAMYHSGKEVQLDYQEAARLWKLAAEQGDAGAQSLLGFIYDIGWTGVPGDPKESFKWYKLAAEQGDAGAQYEVGYRYYLGTGVRINYKQALYWGTLAEAQGHKFEEEYLTSVKSAIKMGLTGKEVEKLKKEFSNK